MKNEAVELGDVLLNASFSGDVSRVNEVLSKNKSILCTRGRLALANACSRGNIEVVSILLRSGCDVNAADGPRGETPLYHACFWGNLSIVDILLRAGADVNSITTKSKQTPLHAASFSGSPSITKALLRAGANISLVDISGETALFTAVVLSHFEVVQEIFQFFSSKTSQNQLPSGFLETKDSRGETALYAASSRGFLPIVEMLLLNGSDVNCVDQNGWTPLLASSHGNKTDVADVLKRSGGKIPDEFQTLMTKRLQELQEIKQSALKYQNQQNGSQNQSNPILIPTTSANISSSTTTLSQSSPSQSSLTQSIPPPPPTTTTTTSSSSSSSSIPSIIVLNSGWLSKSGKINKWMVLYQDKLIYLKTPQAPNPQGTILIKEINDCSLAKSEDVNGRKELLGVSNIFKLVTPKRVYFLVAETPAGAQTWIEKIRNCMQSAVVGNAVTKVK